MLTNYCYYHSLSQVETTPKHLTDQRNVSGQKMKFKFNIVLIAALFGCFISSSHGSINIALCRGADQAGGIGKAVEYKSFVGMICGGG